MRLASFRSMAVGAVFLATQSLGVLYAGTAGASEVKELTIQVDLPHGFAPKAPELTTGTTVIWQNLEKADYPLVRGAHTVVADDGSFQSPEITPGASWTRTFFEPGTFTYHCTLHPNLLSGTLIVTGPAIEPPAQEKDVAIVEPGGSVQDARYEPTDLIGVAGLTVTWRNQGAQPHTVTVDGGFDSGNIDPGKSWSRRFPTATSLAYYCTLHPWMKGSVRIAAEGGEPPPPPPQPAAGPPRGTRSTDLAPLQPRRADGPITLRVNAVEPDASDPRSWGFAPPSLTARVGDSVVWTNAGSAPHTATASDHSFDSGTLQAGGTYTYTLEKTGTLGYICSLHPWMQGSVRILPRGTATSVLGEQITKGAPGGAASPPLPVKGPSSDGSDTVVPRGPMRMRLQNEVIAASLIFSLLVLLPAGTELRRRRVAPPRLAPFEPVAEKMSDVARRELVSSE